jgi:hypothetical protein
MATKKNNSRLKKLVLDVLKPNEPHIFEFSRDLANLDGIDTVEIRVVELDKRVETIKITILGSDISYGSVSSVIDTYGASIHSVDEVLSGC